MRYIDIVRKVVRNAQEKDIPALTYEQIHHINAIRQKVDDIEIVVRRKDCRYYDKYPTWSACTYWSGDPYEQATVDDNDFCSRGERKGGGDE